MKLFPLSAINHPDPTYWAEELPDGSPAKFSAFLRVTGQIPENVIAHAALVVLAGSPERAESPNGVAVYVEIYDSDGFTVGSYVRYLPTVSAGLRIIGFLESPIETDTLSLLSFDWVPF